MAKLDIDAIDLKTLSERVREAMEGTPLEGPVTGRSVVRDVVAAHLACSMLEAEEVVDTMIARGWARLETAEDGREVWRIERGA